MKYPHNVHLRVRRGSLILLARGGSGLKSLANARLILCLLRGMV